MNSYSRQTPSVPLASLRGTLPEVEIAESVDHATISSACIKHLGYLHAEHLTSDALWRDLYALTDTRRTFYGSTCIQTVWSELASRSSPSRFALVANSSSIIRAGPKSCWIQAKYTFETEKAFCSGFVGIIPDSHTTWKIWFVSTVMEQIKGFANPDILEPRYTNGVAGLDVETDCSDFGCVVVGAGMAGLCTAGRLKALGVSSVTIDRNDHIGDNWMLRYESAKRKSSLFFML